MKSFAVVTLGCKVNDYESTFVSTKLIEKGYIKKEYSEICDIYVVFTCCVTNTAESKTRKFIRRVRRTNPNAYIVAVGCFNQVRNNDLVLNEVDLIIGSTQKDKIIDLIEEGIKGNKVEELDNVRFEELYFNNYPSKSRSFLKIQDGCNQFCSYCIIPYARGKERSGNHEFIISEAKELSKTNKEIVLTGIHTGRYNDGEFNLYKLLKELIKIDTISTIRLSSIEMNEVSDEIIDLIASSNKIAHHLHIPVQSCSNEILKSMNRPYSIDEYISFVDTIRKKIPDISISTDLIVGFPGESEELFKETINNIKRINFSFIHCFPYAKKTGTKASLIKEQVDESIKKERVKEILEIDNELRIQYTKSFINKEVDVLIEKNDNGKSYGYSKQYFYVEINETLNTGDIYRVKITDCINDKIIGVICS